MNFRSEYGISKYSNKMGNLMKATSKIIGLYGVEMYGALSVDTTRFTEVPAVYTDRLYMSEANLRDIEEKMGCPEYTFECLNGDQYGIFLTHEIEKGVKVDKCNLETFDANSMNKITRAMTMLTNEMVKKFDKAHLNVIEATAPVVGDDATITKDNILEKISGAGTALTTDEALPVDESDVTIIVPTKYKGYMKQAFKEELKVNMTFEILKNGVSVSEYDGFKCVFWSEATQITATTSDAWAVVLACWDNWAIQTFTNRNLMELFSRFKTGGGYAFRYKSKIDGEEFVKKIVTVKEATAGTGTTPTVAKSGYSTIGLRVVSDADLETRNTAITTANTDLAEKRVDVAGGDDLPEIPEV